MSADAHDRNAPAERAPASRYGLEAQVNHLERLKAALRDEFEIHREVGRGGAAFVYLALDKRSNKEVALKVLRPEFSAALVEARFRREAEIGTSLRHPNILALFDIGAAEGQMYFTMPYVAGETLRARIRRETQMRMRDVVRIARDVARALDYAHGKQVVHRDIKPANILLETGNTLVADFGIARAMRVVTGEEITDSGVVIGTPEYMSPEQSTGERKLDGRSDIYALGCVVYEMLAGEPPFTGPNAQAIIARHNAEPPRSIRVIRREIPLGVEEAIGKALAKSPADRFDTATEFVDAIEAGIAAGQTDIFGIAHLTRRGRALVSAGIVLAGGGIIASAVIPPTQLDVNHVVVFPLYDAAERNRGEGVATFIYSALDGSRPLTFRDGWEALAPESREGSPRIAASSARKFSRNMGAGYFIDGSILPRTDSLTVVTRLYDVRGDSVIRAVARTGALTESAEQLGLAAVQALLPDIVAPGGLIDRPALAARRPGAVANWLQGEREYRRMRFAEALPHFRAALRDDSVFALAALRGSYAASWLSQLDEAEDLVAAAERHAATLTPAQAAVARAMSSYLTGSGDSAIAHLRRALRADSLVHGGWTLLGETYARVPSSEWAADSLARASLQHALRIDPDFSPTLLLLEEFALRDGNVAEAERLRTGLVQAGAETTHVSARRLMHQCISGGPASVDWSNAMRRDSMATLGAAKVLGGAAAQPACAIAAFREILSTTATPANIRRGALLGLEAQLAAVGRPTETWTALELEGARQLPWRIPVLVGAAANGAFAREAAAIADSAVTTIARLSIASLWLLSDFELRRGNIDRLALLAAAAKRRADSSQARGDARMASSIAARWMLARGDTTAALASLRSLDSRVARQELEWNPWASLASERMLIARIAFSRKQFEEARRTATFIDSPEPIGNPFYLRESLTLRAQAADSLGNPSLAARYRARLKRLDSCCRDLR